MVFHDPKLASYRGTAPYIFLSYSHRDADDAAEVIGRLKEDGFRVWYDEGLTPGAEFDDIIADRVASCGYFIALMSRNFVDSSYCKDEVTFALSEKRPIIVLYLDDVELSKGMRMRLQRYQALYKHTDRERVYEMIRNAEGIEVCRGPEVSAPAPARAPAPERAEVPLAYRATLRADNIVYNPSSKYNNMDLLFADAEQFSVFGLEVCRGEVRNLTFLADASARPGDARDLSGAGDGSLWGWAERQGELWAVTIAADGGMKLPEDASGYFAGYTRLEEIRWNGAVSFAEVKDARYLFAGCKALTALELKQTCRPVTVQGMFHSCFLLTRLTLSGLHTENTQQMAYMFCACESMTELDLSGLDTAKTASFFYMFAGCKRLQALTLDPDRFRTLSATSMRGMFFNCPSLTELDLSFFVTVRVTDMAYMFYLCSSLRSLDLSSFNTAKVTDISNMFNGCESLSTLTWDPDSFRTLSATRMNGMFGKCSSLKTLDLSGFNTGKVTDMAWMFTNCSSLKSLDLSSFNTARVTDMSNMFNGCESLKTLDVSTFNTGKVTNMAWMFAKCSSLRTLILDPETFRTDKAVNMGCMFCGCIQLEKLDLSGFNTAAAENMSWMLADCASLRSLSLDPETFRTDKVTNIGCMFYGCSLPEDFDCSFLDLRSAEDTNYLFLKCIGPTSLTFSSPLRLGQKMFAGSTIEELHFRDRILGAEKSAFADCTLRAYYNPELTALTEEMKAGLGGTAEWIPE